MSDKPRARDNCILYIEKLIRDMDMIGYENSKCFQKALLIGLEAGIKLERGDFDINSLEYISEDKDD